MTKDPSHTPTEADKLFQQAMEGVTPITPSDRITSASTTPRFSLQNKRTDKVHTVTDALSDHAVSDVAATSFLRSGMNKMTLRKLRKGYWPREDSIDLHGYTIDEARHQLQVFITQAHKNNFRCINIVHGKGWHTEGGEGILKIRVRHWLTQLPQVLAFCEPPANAGGSGAVWVLLKSGFNS